MEALLPDGVRVSHPGKLFIGGRWQPPASGQFIEVVSPDTETVVARVAEAGEADMALAVAAARQAFDNGPWARLSVAARSAYLVAMGEYLIGRIPQLAEAHRAQMGALINTATEIARGAARTLSAHAAMGETYGWVSAAPSVIPGHTRLVRREPVGVVAAITPWNVPFVMMINKVAPALLCGCTVIMKPAPETPLEAYIIAEAAEAAGLPPGVVNLVPGHRDAADYLVRQPGVDKISFTGSTTAGRRIASVAGERMARVTLELGGKSPAVVLNDFPVEVAGAKLARAITMLSGQVCLALSRVIVPRERQHAIADAIVAEMEKIRIGPSNDAASEMGPLAMARQRDRVEGYIARAKASDTTLATGGGRPRHLDRGFFVEPTLFMDVDNASQLAQEEVFGPVLALIPAKDEAHALALANESSYGLNASIFTNDDDRFVALAATIRAGTVAQNGFKIDYAAPFGGYKQSGIGREGGVEGLAAYMETKTVLAERHAGAGSEA